MLPCACLAQGSVVSDTLSSIDSLSIFRLLDSLMQNLDDLEETNQLALRAGYNSNINGYSNTAGLSQYGLSAGASFYHKSGLFADVTGYYSTEYEPHYYQTMASIGYMNSSLKKFSFLAEYRKSFYSFDVQQPASTPDYIFRVRGLANFSNNYSSVAYSNAFTSTVYFEHKLINLRLDYTLLAEGGYMPSHRVMPTASLNLEKKKWLKTQRIRVFPSVSWLYGGSPFDTYQFEKLYKTRIEALLRVRNGLPLFKVKKRTDLKWETLNWSFSLPISVSWKHTLASISYTHNLPENGGYFTCSLIRTIDFRNRRKNLP